MTHSYRNDRAFHQGQYAYDNAAEPEGPAPCPECDGAGCEACEGAGWIDEDGNPSWEE